MLPEGFDGRPAPRRRSGSSTAWSTRPGRAVSAGSSCRGDRREYERHAIVAAQGAWAAARLRDARVAAARGSILRARLAGIQPMGGGWPRGVLAAGPGPCEGRCMAMIPIEISGAQVLLPFWIAAIGVMSGRVLGIRIGWWLADGRTALCTPSACQLGHIRSHAQRRPVAHWLAARFAPSMTAGAGARSAESSASGWQVAQLLRVLQHRQPEVH
jgi:hypothetical protein